MKRNTRNARIARLTNLAIKRETIKILANHQLGLVAGGYQSSQDQPTCSSGDPICDPK